MATVRNTPDLNLNLAGIVASLVAEMAFSIRVSGAIGNGTTAGNLRTTAASTYNIAGLQYTLASTDDLWDLSGETDTTAGQFRAYWLYADAAGTTSIVAGANATSSALALGALPDPSDTLSIMGVYVAGAATDFNAAGGLAAQGTIYNGIPAGANIGAIQNLHQKPTIVKVVAG